MTSSSEPLDWIDDELSKLDRLDLRRHRIAHDGAVGAAVRLAGVSGPAADLVNFASNDYLGLAADPRLMEAAATAAREAGWGAGASPLLAGYAAAHERLERQLAAFEGTQRALLFSSGYAANVGTIAALVGAGDVVYSDELNHASIVDGCRLSKAEVRVYQHGDTVDLAFKLDDAGRFRRRLIVSDSLFSMHGDSAPLADLASLARRHHAMLMVDEAHATGVFGPRGRGLCEQFGVAEAVHVRVGTLSKALGCSGGFVAGPHNLVEWLINKARSCVFSTASPPANSAAASAALKIVDSEPQRRTALLERAADLRRKLTAQGWNIGTSESQIVPIFVGAPSRAVDLSNALRRRGIWVPAIRPPSVPSGQSCLRISLCSGHTEAMTNRLAAALSSVRESS
ncbi:MAG: 8-amino-7-oxononanoate synthase [Planctomycetia bacterium]|nr:8-amino-7-oxononanoate synthase [Planctomycetia bacterium]